MDTGPLGYFPTLLAVPLTIGLVVLLIGVAAAAIWGLTNVLTKVLIDAVQRRIARSGSRLDQRRISGIDGAGVVHPSIDDMFADGARDVR